MAGNNGTLATPKKQAKPEVGEATKPQAKCRSSVGMGGIFDALDCSRGTYAQYRKMRANPTVALARAVGTAAIKSAEFSVQADDDAPDDAVKLIQDTMARIWRGFIKDALFARDYGWAPFEKVWALKDGALTIDKAKPLLVDITQPIDPEKSNGLEGLKNGDVILGPDKSFVWTYDGECGNVYGRSIFENIREYAYDPWTSKCRQSAQYYAKVAPIIMMCRYPQGASEGENGAMVDNAVHADNLLASVPKSMSIAIPTTFPPWAEAMLQRGMDPSQLAAWQFEFLETSAGHGSEFLEGMKHDESLMMRGLLVPERAAIEGQNGTKAEAGVHGDVAISIQEQDLRDIVDCINRYIVDDILRVNFGPEMEGKVYVEAQPLAEEDRSTLKAIVTGILTNPMNMDIATQLMDFDAALDEVGIPKAEEVVDLKSIPDPRKETPVNVANPADPASPPAEPLPSTKLARALAAGMRKGLHL